MTFTGAARPTMLDVAISAGVSRSTVSRVLQGRGRFSRESHFRVLRAVQELGFVPNILASELASPSSSVIGLLLRDASNPAYAALFVELARAAHEHQLPLISMTVHHDEGGGQQIVALRRMLGMRVAGLVVATGDVTSEQLEPFRASLPILRAGRPATNSLLNAISYDEVNNATLIAEYLLAAGHRRVVVILPTATLSYPEHVRGTTMIEVLGAGGCAVHVVAVTDTNDQGATHAADLVARYGATAVMATTDRRQMAVMRELGARGLSVPGDVSVTGLDGLMAGLDLLGLTTVRLPVEALAQRAMSVMSQLISGAGSGLIQEKLCGQLIPGSTVASPAAHRS
ncbi:MAG: LacI family transcriptional regulator [Glaciihabitans sp.]|nr:LacI family transcriptional regulator [Glaciihabitans sp.]